MAKKLIEAPRGNIFMLEPDKLVLVTDTASALYDERVHLDPSESMILNIMEFGIIEPVIIRKNSEDGKLEVVAGRQRVKAVIEANKRLKKQGAEQWRVPCIARRGEASALMGVMISENEARIEDTPLGRAKKLARYLDLGRTNEEAARTFCISTASVKNLLALLDAPKEIRNAVQNGKISTSDGYKLAKMQPEEAKKKLKQVESTSPKPEAQARRKRGTAKKAREILSGKSEMRSRAEVEKRREELAESDVAGEIKREMDAVFGWVLGDDASLDEWMGESEPTATSAG